MRRNLMTVFLAVSMAACGGGDDNSPTVSVFLADDFAGAFPGTSWTITAGSPAIDGSSGNPLPSLIMAASGGDVRARTGEFAASSILTLTVSFAIPGFVMGQSGKAVIALSVQGNPAGDASFEVDIDNARLVAGIGATAATLPFTPDAAFHSISFSYAYGSASWSWDGATVFSQIGHPGGWVRVELQAAGGSSAVFAYDNVALSGAE